MMVPQHLPPLCLELVCAAVERDDVLDEPRPAALVARDAAACARVGCPRFTSIAWALFERLDPGCTSHACRELQARRASHAQFLAREYAEAVAAVEAEYAEAVPSPHATASSTVAVLKAECKRLGAGVTGTKAALWANLQRRQEAAAEARERTLRSLDARRARAPALARCPVRKEARAELASFFTRSVTASTAKKDHGLSERDLQRLPCREVRNPHYRCAAPMRLYPLRDVYEASRRKKATARASPAAAAASSAAAKRKQTRAANISRAIDELGRTLLDGGVDLQELRGACEDAARVYDAFVRSPPRSADAVAGALQGMWARYAELRDALRAAGCAFRGDSRLCRAYVAHGAHGDVQAIATTMREMRFYIECTDYDALRRSEFAALRASLIDGHDQDDREWMNEASRLAKGKALAQWARRWASRAEAAARPELPDSLRALV